MQRFEFTTMDRIISSVQRNTGEEEISEENIVEWAGEALEELYRRGSLQECVLFAKVKNFTVEMPTGFKYVSGVLKNFKLGSNWWNCVGPEEIEKELPCSCPGPCEEDCKKFYVSQDGCFWEMQNRDTHLRQDMKHTLYGIPVPYIDVPWAFNHFFTSYTCTQNFQRLSLVDSRFSNHKVQQNTDLLKSLHTCGDSYSLQGRHVKFSFENGQVAIAYLKIPTDPETGYPLIPDNSSYINAITYYIKWKMAEFYSWSGREGFAGEVDKAMALWQKYAAQARVKTIKIRTQDEYKSVMGNSRGFGTFKNY